MVSLNNARGSRKVHSAPTARVSRSTHRTSMTARPKSAPGRISLNRNAIMKMSRSEARETLRATPPMTFYKLGKRGLILFTLLIICALEPAMGHTTVANSAHGAPPPYIVGRVHNEAIITKRATPWQFWTRMFSSSPQAKVAGASDIAQAGAALAVGAATGSGAATSSFILWQISKTPFGQFFIIMVIIAFIVKHLVDYGKSRHSRNTQKIISNTLLVQIKEQAETAKMQARLLEAWLLTQQGGGSDVFLPGRRASPRRRSRTASIGAQQLALPPPNNGQRSASPRARSAAGLLLRLGR